MIYLDKLIADQIISEPLPLKDILNDSYFYPACWFDGQLVKFAPKNIVNFIYCDHATGETALLENLKNEPFIGYTTLAERDVKKEELVPLGWRPETPPNFTELSYAFIGLYAEPAFAKWFVFERKSNRTDTYGPSRFALLYIGGEGVATYQALYWGNNFAPEAIAIIQPGVDFGNNWTDFIVPTSDLHWVVYNNPSGLPSKIYYGGRGRRIEFVKEFKWEGYLYETSIYPYYGNFKGGELTIWHLNNLHTTSSSNAESQQSKNC